MASGMKTMEDVRIGFKNFSGKEGKYNRSGDRNFVIFLNEDWTEELVTEGWNVRTLQPRDPDEEPQPYLPVAVRFGARPPRVVLITSRGKTTIGEDEISMLDWADIKQVDLVVRPYEWEVSGNTGIKAYLKSLFVTLEEDDLDLKYADVPDSAASAIIPVEEPEEF